MRNRKVYDGEIGYEIKGASSPKFKRKQQCGNEDDIQIEIPNGDIINGKAYYNQNCTSCHHLDVDTLLGPSLRNVYMRKYGKKNLQHYGSGDLNLSNKFYWNRKKLWQFLKNPEQMFADTIMQNEGINDPFILASIIDYLQYLSIFTVDNRKNKII